MDSRSRLKHSPILVAVIPVSRFRSVNGRGTCVGISRGMRSKGSSWFCGVCGHIYNRREGTRILSLRDNNRSCRACATTHGLIFKHQKVHEQRYCNAWRPAFHDGVGQVQPQYRDQCSNIKVHRPTAHTTVARGSHQRSRMDVTSANIYRQSQ